MAPARPLIGIGSEIDDGRPDGRVRLLTPWRRYRPGTPRSIFRMILRGDAQWKILAPHATGPYPDGRLLDPHARGTSACTRRARAASASKSSPRGLFRR